MAPKVYREEDGYVYREMVPEDVETCVKFGCETFSKYEEISAHLQAKPEEHVEWFHAHVHECAKNGLSLVVEEPGTHDIVGFGAICDLATYDPPLLDAAYAKMAPRLLPIYKVTDQIEHSYKEMRQKELGRPIEAGEIAMIVMGTVRGDHVGHKLCTISIAEHLRFAKEKGFRYFAAATTGNISRHILVNKFGLVEKLKIDYKTWECDGKIPFADVREKMASRGCCFLVKDLEGDDNEPVGPPRL